MTHAFNCLIEHIQTTPAYRARGQLSHGQRLRSLHKRELPKR